MVIDADISNQQCNLVRPVLAETSRSPAKLMRGRYRPEAVKPTKQLSS